MTAPELNELRKEEAARRRQLEELGEAQKWVHHAADLRTGRVVSTALNRPVTAASRAQRMARLGHQFDTSIFGEPWFRLTARTAFVASPTAFLTALNPTSYRPDENRILWFPPRDFSEKGFFASMSFFFAEAPRPKSLLSLSLQTRAFQGAVGHILISAPFPTHTPVQFPINDVMSAHTFDVVFVPPEGQPTSVVMTIQEGIQLLDFRSASLQSEPPVFDSGP